MSSSEKGTKKTKSKKIIKDPKIIPDSAKIRKKPQYKSFRLHKRVKHPDLNIPSARKISIKAINLMKINFKQLFYFFLIYGILYLIFVRGISSPINIDEIKSEIEVLTGGSDSIWSSNITVMGLLLGSSINVSGEIAGLYQLIFYTISALALIWLFRQQQAGNKVSIKQAYYRGMYPLIPFVLILILIGIQTIPATIGNFLFTTVTQNGIATTALEQFIWFLLYFSTIILSLYLISSSLIALFIVTLPEMTPILALKKAKDLVLFRRASILRKVTFLLVVVLLSFVVFVMPMLFVSSLLAQIVFFIVTVMVVPFVVAYLFVLYRELL